MKQLRLPIFNSKIKYYNLRIVPSEDVCHEITELKKQFQFLFGKQPLSRSKPHITIATFKMNSKHQDFLRPVFEQLSQIDSFDLNIKGFSAFEGSRTLCLSISKSEALEVIHHQVQSLYHGHLKRKLKLFSISHVPHITISKTTGKQMLNESLQHFQKSTYSKLIEVDQLTLVSRAKYKTWDWEHSIKLS